MDVIFGLIPAMIVLGLLSVFVFFWAVKNGQYEDMEGPAHRILEDDDLGDRKKTMQSTDEARILPKSKEGTKN